MEMPAHRTGAVALAREAAAATGGRQETVKRGMTLYLPPFCPSHRSRKGSGRGEDRSVQDLTLLSPTPLPMDGGQMRLGKHQTGSEIEILN